MKCHTSIMNKRVWLLLGCLLLVPGLSQAYEGFGAAATGGTGQRVYRVTNCSNGTGDGTLRDATSQPNRYIVFDVGCSPPVKFGKQWVYIRSNTTLDGFTAPSPGYQYLGTLAVGGQNCSPRCHNVIVRGMIYRGDGVTVTNFALKVERGAHTIVFDHNTMERCGNDCIGISSNEGKNPVTYVDSRNITISRNLLNHPSRSDPGAEGSEAGAETAMLVTNRSRRISVLYNLIYDSKRRNPRFEYDRKVPPTDTVFDIRNNLIYKVSGLLTQDGGIILYDRVRGNVINNWLKAKDTLRVLAGRVAKKVIMVCKDSGNASEDRGFCGPRSAVENVYISGNISADGWSAHINGKGTTGTPQAVPPSTTMDACAAAQSVRQDVGAPHKSASDLAALNDIVLHGCTPGAAPGGESPARGRRFVFTPW
jgi:hypothetical protein